MGYVVLRHGKNWNHCDGTGVVANSARAFIHARKIGIEIARIAAATWHLFSRGGNFAQGLRVVGDIRNDDEHMHTKLISQVFRRGDRHTWGCNALNRRIVREVDERYRFFNCAGLAKVADEKVGFFKRDADGGEDDRKLLIRTKHLCLTRNLRG
ncbi:hypothetical protein SDC9_169388 [bioreactor metagenome]|uniref:Uncharacterized protein n=1 Tax=bioreactor metagenome TaxID=1076179 RepID=A0A645G5S6_9ZZZZ